MDNSPLLRSMPNAYGDLQRRTLAGMTCDFARLIYLASTRDYNSGLYHHEGLAFRFGRAEARAALQAAHCEVFCRLVSLSLEGLVAELEIYIRDSHEAPEGLVHTWQHLEPYRISVPMEVDSTMVELFLSNIKIALEVLRFHREKSRQSQSASSLRQLLDR